MPKTRDNNTKENILSASRKLFYAQGYKKTTIRQIQKLSNNLSIHYHYKHKKSIALELFSKYLDSIDSVFLDIDSLQKGDNFLNMMTRLIYILKCIIQNDKERVYYFESLQECKIDYYNLLIERDLTKMINISKQYADKDISPDLVKCYYLISLSSQEELFPGVYNGLFNFTLDDMIKIQVKIGPLLYGINGAIIDDKYAQALELVKQIGHSVSLLL